MQHGVILSPVSRICLFSKHPYSPLYQQCVDFTLKSHPRRCSPLNLNHVIQQQVRTLQLPDQRLHLSARDSQKPRRERSRRRTEAPQSSVENVKFGGGPSKALITYGRCVEVFREATIESENPVCGMSKEAEIDADNASQWMENFVESARSAVLGNREI
jgi:hypothetical protein